MYKNIKRYQKYKNIKVDNNYLCARTCDSDCSFTRVKGYVNKIKEILTDTGKFEKLSIPPGKEYNFIINQEKRIMDVLKPLHNKKAIDKDCI